MVVDQEITSVEDFPGKLHVDAFSQSHVDVKKAGIPFDALEHSIMLPQDSAAAFVSGGLDIDVNYIPFSSQSVAKGLTS